MSWCFSLASLVLAGAVSVAPGVLAAGQTDREAPAEEPSGFSLDDLDELDALLEEDSEGAVSPLSRAEVIDLVGLVLVLGFAMLSFVSKSKSLKYVALGLSVSYLGFYKANLVSVVNVYSLVTWNLPEFRSGLTWYVLAIFAVVTTVLWGRVYCGRICAFGALTQLMDALVPSKFRYELSPSVDKWAVKAKYFILAGVLAYFVASSNVLPYRYVEPFWMFTLNGNAIMWTLLALLLLATVFVRNLYCRYLCSLGAALGVISNLTVFRIKRWQECKTCKICGKACEWGAIQGPKIIASECVRCDDCERISADENQCVHWLLERKTRAKPAQPMSV